MPPETSPFARAGLEHRLVMVDDDIKLEALPQTNHLKTIVTAEMEMDLEKKGGATSALQNVADIKTVSGMLGHFSAVFTLDTYAHVTTSAQKEAAQTMGNILSM